MNIALISYNVIRITQILADYYEKKGDSVYHFLFTRRKQLDYSTKGEVVYLNKNNVSETDFILFSMDMIELSEKLKKLKKKYNIDVAISFVEAFHLLNVLSKSKEKCIISVRTTLSLRTDFYGYEYRKWIIRKLYNRADKIVTAGEYSKFDLISNYKVNKNKVFSISNPAISYSENNQMTEKWVYGSKVVISVTRFDPVKQVDRIIRAFSYVHKLDNEAKLILLGDGIEKEYLVSITKEMGLEDAVCFLGYKHNIGFYLSNSKMFVMASRVEGFPNAMVEAMSNGLPIITTNAPGSCHEIIGQEMKNEGEIIYCEYGILAPYIVGRKGRNEKLDKEEIALGKAIMSVFENEEIYEKYSNQSLVRSKNYEYNKIMNEWDSVMGKSLQ